MEGKSKTHTTLYKGPVRFSRSVGVLGGFKQELVWGRVLFNVFCIFKDSQEAVCLLRMSLDPENVKVTCNPKVCIDLTIAHLIQHPKLTPEQRGSTIALTFSAPPVGCTHLVMLFAESEEHAAAWKVALCSAMVCGPLFTVSLFQYSWSAVPVPLEVLVLFFSSHKVSLSALDLQ
jgi:hypothetical protein